MDFWCLSTAPALGWVSSTQPSFHQGSQDPQSSDLCKIAPFSWLRKMHPKRFPGSASGRIVPVSEVFGCMCVWEWSVNDAHPKIQQLQWEKRGENLGGGFRDNEMSVSISEVIPGRMDGYEKVTAGNKGTHHSCSQAVLTVSQNLESLRIWHNLCIPDAICSILSAFHVFISSELSFGVKLLSIVSLHFQVFS